MKKMSEAFTILFEKGDGKWWIATIPEIPGAVSQGKTQKEAREMVIDCAKELMSFRREEAIQAGGIAKIEAFRFAN